MIIVYQKYIIIKYNRENNINFIYHKCIQFTIKMNHELINFQKAEEAYLSYLDIHSRYESFCSGVGSCEDCDKEMYPLRRKYIKAYIMLYKSNKELCSKINWCETDVGTNCNLHDFHKQHCNNDMYIATCSCELANFIRTACHEYSETATLKSFHSQIYPIFKKIICT